MEIVSSSMFESLLHLEKWVLSPLSFFIHLICWIKGCRIALRYITSSTAEKVLRQPFWEHVHMGSNTSNGAEWCSETTESDLDISRDFHSFLIPRIGWLLYLLHSFPNKTVSHPFYEFKFRAILWNLILGLVKYDLLISTKNNKNKLVRKKKSSWLNV